MAALSNSPCITIGDVVIHQDADGRYSLNDLHKASGEAKRHQPANWLRNQQTQELIAELSGEQDSTPQIRGVKKNQPVTVINGGDNPGTYVVRELVYAYAMWISPSFHLKVIRTFDAVMTGHVAAVETLLPSEQQTLSEIVHAKVAHLAPEMVGKGLAEVWSRLHHKFRIAKYSQLPRTRLAEAILYVTQMTLRGVPGPAPEPTITTISPAQQRQLANAVQQAMCGWVFTNEHSQHAYNALRVIFHLEHIADLPATDFERAIFVVDRIREMNWQFLSWVCEVRDAYLREYVMAGGPWTPWLKREWKKQMQTALPKRPNWLEIQQQLALKGSGTPVAI
ncbi:MAG: KilA-N domain-containing protein [Chromatiales bacterium]|nr:KilA-N domain-containing protein [Chromatiales bacterium]MCK7581094.1 KilA-N domain-containing protein [Chromatiales bacterium]